MRIALADLPNHKFVVVAPACYCCLVVRAPSQPTNLLSVPKKLLYHLRWPHVSNENSFVFTTTSYKRVWPSSRANSVQVPSHGPNHLLMLHVPNLYLAIQCANWKTVSTPILRPRNRRNLIEISEVRKFGYACSVCVPDVDWIAESDCQLVWGGPVDQVKVEVITKVRGIQNSKGLLSNFTLALCFRRWICLTRNPLP